MTTRWEAIDWRGELARLQNELHHSLGRAASRWQMDPGGVGGAYAATGTRSAASGATGGPGGGAAGSPATTAAGGSASAATSGSAATTPAINVWADEENIYVESELPGVDAGDVELFVTGRQLTFRGERKPPVVEKGVWHRQERPHGRFQRTLELPVDVDTAAVEAQFQNGVLLVKLPKHAEIRPRRVEIKVG